MILRVLTKKILAFEPHASAVEYGVLAALFSTALLTILLAMGGSLGEIYDAVVNDVAYGVN